MNESKEVKLVASLYQSAGKSQPISEEKEKTIGFKQ